MKKLISPLITYLLAVNLSFGQIAPISNKLYTKSAAYELEEKKHKSDKMSNKDFRQLSRPVWSLYGAAAGYVSQNSDSENDNANENSGISTGIRVIKEFDWSFSVGFVLNFNDTIQDNYGKALLVPGKGNSGINIRFDKYHFVTANRTFFSLSSLEFGLSNNKWRLDDETHQVLQGFLKIVPTIGIYKESGENTVSVWLGAGYTSRFTLGDFNRRIEFRENTIGTTKDYFHGLEFQFSLSVNQARFFAELPIILSGEDVDGLTGPQLIVGVNISTDMISLSN